MTNRVKSIMSLALAIWFVFFSVFLYAGHHHSEKLYNCGEQVKPYSHHTMPDNALLLTCDTAQDGLVSYLSSTCFVCMFLANYSLGHPVTPPSPVLSYARMTLDICKPISFIASLNQSPDSPRAPPC